MRHLAFLAVLALIAGCGSGEQPSSNPTQKIGLIQYTSTKSLDDLREGFLEGLEASGYKPGEGVEVVVRNAEGDAGTLSLAMRQFKDQGVTMVGVVSTQALQAAISSLGQTPIVFCGVMDPVAAGVGPSLDQKKPNITGVENPFPVEDGIEMVTSLAPNAKVIGSLYDPSEAFAEGLLKRAEAACKQRGLKWVAISVSSTTDIVSGTQALAARGVQAILQLPGNTTNQGVAGQVQQCRQLKIPMFSLQADQIPSGVVAAIGVDLKGAGVKAGKLAAEVLKGRKTADLPIQRADNEPLKTNEEEMKRFGLALKS